MTATVTYRGGIRELDPAMARRLASIAALLYLVVGFSALAMGLSAWRHVEHPAVFAVETLIVVAIGLVLLWLARTLRDETITELTPGLGHLLLFTAGAGITGGLLTAGPSLRIGAIVYLVHPIFCVYMFTRWRAAMVLVLVGLEYAVVLVVQHDVAPVGQWLFLMAILGVTAVVTGGFVDQLDRLAASERQARVALAEASEQKSAFLASMSHELRTPLNAVIGFSEVLQERVFGDLNERQAEYVDDVVASGRHLLQVINDVLDLSKVEAGHMELSVDEVDVAELVEGAVSLVRPQAALAGITLRVELDAESGSIHGDAQKLRQVLVNLLANAVKFTPDGGAVTIVAQRSQGRVAISVSDTGPGISAADQERIFEEFAQAGPAVPGRQPGTGLGLTLARRFTELHDGRITVDSRVGEGATFRVEVPVA